MRKYDSKFPRPGVGYREFSVKIERLKQSGKDKEFRKRLISIGFPRTGFLGVEDITSFVINLAYLGKHKVYETQLKELAANFDFENREELHDLEMYLLTGGPVIASRTLLETKFKKNESTGEIELWLRIQGDTRVEDIKNEWPHIMQYQQQLQDYKKPKKPWSKFFIHKRVYELHKKGFPAKDVADEMKRLMGDDPNAYWDETRVWRIVSDFKKRVIKTTSKKTPK